MLIRQENRKRDRYQKRLQKETVIIRIMDFKSL